MSENEPPWFTHSLKQVINQRWDAYRSGNFNRYNFLKVKAKEMILRAKFSWAKRSSLSSKNLWETTHSLLGSKNKNNSINSLNLKFSDCETAANSINSSLCNVFQTENFNYDVSDFD